MKPYSPSYTPPIFTFGNITDYQYKVKSLRQEKFKLNFMSRRVKSSYLKSVKVSSHKLPKTVSSQVTQEMDERDLKSFKK